MAEDAYGDDFEQEAAILPDSYRKQALIDIDDQLVQDDKDGAYEDEWEVEGKQTHQLNNPSRTTTLQTDVSQSAEQRVAIVDKNRPVGPSLAAADPPHRGLAQRMDSSESWASASSTLPSRSASELEDPQDLQLLTIEGKTARFDVDKAMRALQSVWQSRRQFQETMLGEIRGAGKKRPRRWTDGSVGTKNLDNALWAGQTHALRAKAAAAAPPSSSLHGVSRVRPKSAGATVKRADVKEIIVDFSKGPTEPGKRHSKESNKRPMSATYRRSNMMNATVRLELETVALLEACGIQPKRTGKPLRPAQEKLLAMADKLQERETRLRSSSPREQRAASAPSICTSSIVKESQGLEQPESRQKKRRTRRRTIDLPQVDPLLMEGRPGSAWTVAQIPERELKSLSPVEVGYLLHSLGLGRYASSFLELGVSGADLLLCQEDDLQHQCGMSFRPHRLRLLTEVKKLSLLRVPISMLIPGGGGSEVFPQKTPQRDSSQALMDILPTGGGIPTVQPIQAWAAAPLQDAPVRAPASTASATTKRSFVTARAQQNRQTAAATMVQRVWRGHSVRSKGTEKAAAVQEGGDDPGDVFELGGYFIRHVEGQGEQEEAVQFSNGHLKRGSLSSIIEEDNEAESPRSTTTLRRNSSSATSSSHAEEWVLESSAIIIQRHVRGYRARKATNEELAQILWKRKRQHATVMIQKHIRSFLARKEATRRRQQAEAEHLRRRQTEAAVKIQKTARGFVARRKCKRKIEEEARLRADEERRARKLQAGAVEVQRVWRGFQGRRLSQEMRLERDYQMQRLREEEEEAAKRRMEEEEKERLEEERRRAAAEEEEREEARRKWEAAAEEERRRREAEEAEVRQREQEEVERLRRLAEEEAKARQLEASAVAIQRVWRGHQGRMLSWTMHAERQEAVKAVSSGGDDVHDDDVEEEEEEDVLSVTLKRDSMELSDRRSLSGRLLLGLIQQQQQHAPESHVAAIRLQKVWRGHKARVTLAMSRELRRIATLELQRAWRGHRARLQLKRHRAAEISSAVKIQKIWRGHVARITKPPPPPSWPPPSTAKRHSEADAALSIQRSWRGHKARNEVERLKQRSSAASSSSRHVTFSPIKSFEDGEKAFDVFAGAAGQEGINESTGYESSDNDSRTSTQWTLLKDMGEGWGKYQDLKTDEVFYMNAETGEIVADVAAAEVEEEEAAAPEAGSMQEVESTPGVGSSEAEAAAAPPAVDEGVWIRVVDPDSGLEYEYNDVTGESRWVEVEVEDEQNEPEVQQQVDQGEGSTAAASNGGSSGTGSTKPQVLLGAAVQLYDDGDLDYDSD